MAKDITDVMRDTVAQTARDVTKSLGLNGKGRTRGNVLSGAGGVAAGAGIAALAPIVAKGAVRAARRRLTGEAGKAGGGDGPLGKATSKLGDAVGHGVGDKVKQTVEESGGVAGAAKSVGEGMLPRLGGGGGNGKGGAPGVGEGRRMPVQQAMDVAVPVETVYNQWTQFQDWPRFMHRVTEVSQDDPCTVAFSTKVWGKRKRFRTKIETQRPDERIKWRVEDGISHTGVVTFHDLAPRLTRVEMNVDVDPGSLLEKAARGMRHIKRAMRADMHRFKAFIEMQELETGAWRGVIEDGELVEDHDPSYDEERDYAGDDGGASGRGDGSEQEAASPAEEQPAAQQDQPEPAAASARRATPAASGARRGATRRRGEASAAGRAESRRRAPVAGS